MPGNGHVRFGRRAAETDRQKCRHRAAARPHNFVHDPATLIMAFDRVAGNTGSRTPGVDGLTVADVEDLIGVPGFLDDLRAQLKHRHVGGSPGRPR